MEYNLSIMAKIILILALIMMASPLTIEVNNIHYGYKNIYIGNQLSLSSSALTMKNYKLTKQDLPKELLGFITHQDHQINVDFNKLIRKYQVQDLDMQNLVLRYQFEQSTKYLIQEDISSQQSLHNRKSNLTCKYQTNLSLSVKISRSLIYDKIIISYYRWNQLFIQFFMSHPYWRAHYYDCRQDSQDPYKQITIVEHLNIHNLNFQGNQLNGVGLHDTHGNFQIQGTSVGNQVAFTLTYSNRVLHFKGEKNGNVIDGQWKNDEQNGGSFKFTYIVPKQGWNASFKQSDVEDQMDLHNFVVQTVPNGKVIGNGSDSCGNFTIDGHFDHQTNTVHFVKAYENGNQFNYWGVLAGKTIQGQWGYSEEDPQDTFAFKFVD